jgi:hypothetical protein
VLGLAEAPGGDEVFLQLVLARIIEPARDEEAEPKIADQQT